MMSTDPTRDRAQPLGYAACTAAEEPPAVASSASGRIDNRVEMAIRKGRTALLATFACGWLSACGGGDSGTPTVPPSVMVTSSAVSVSATTAQTAPTSLIKATISNPGAGQYYFSKSFTTNGLASITVTSTGNVGSFTLQFKTPSSLAPGTYSDTLTVEACEDSACQQQIMGSPTTVTVKYVVLEGPGIAPQLTRLGPNEVVAGDTGFQLIVAGSNFDAQSVIQWNGTQHPTNFVSSTLLVASISTSDIAVSSNVAVTVANLETAGTTVSNALPFTVSGSSVPATLILSTQSVNASYNTSLGAGALVYNPVVVTVNGSTSATYYYSISFTGSAVVGLAVNGETGLTSGITVPPGPTAGRITGEPNGGLGERITGSFTGPVNFIDQIQFVGASILGAGTYADTITVKVCSDAQCSKPIAGSPQSIAVNYTVTGDPIPNAYYTLENASLVLEAPTSGTAATGTTVITTNGMPPYGAYVFPTSGSGAAVASATVQSDQNGSATVTITTKPPASVGSGIYTDSVQLQICYDSACTKPATSAPLTVQVLYIVDASPGVDFTQTSIPVEIWAMAWNATTERFYATANSDTGGITHSLLVINPVTASIEQVVSLGQNDPTSIALTDNGQYAYIISLQQVIRVDLGTLTIDETVNVSANAIKTVPGEPDSFVVETPDQQLIIYDGTTPRPQSSVAGVPFFTFGADASTVYAYDPAFTPPTMYQLSVSSSGFNTAQTTPNVALAPIYLLDIEYAGGLVYTTTGSVYNPSTQSVESSFRFLNSNPAGTTVFGGALAIDTSLNRAYFVTSDTPNLMPGGSTIEGFNLTTQAPTWITRLPKGGGGIMRWGANGLAYYLGNGVSPTITFISGSVVSR
jgi:hypothetical protein